MKRPPPVLSLFISGRWGGSIGADAHWQIDAAALGSDWQLQFHVSTSPP